MLQALICRARTPENQPFAASQLRPLSITINEDTAIGESVGEEQGSFLSLIQRDELNAAPARIPERLDKVGASAGIVLAEADEQVEIARRVLRSAGCAPKERREPNVRLLAQSLQ